MKWLHGLPTLAGKGYVFEGAGHTSYVVEYTENAQCLSHYTFAKRVDLPNRSGELTLQQLFDRACFDLATTDLTLEFSRDIVHKLVCPTCAGEEEIFAPVGSLRYEDGRCPEDGQMRVVHTLAGYKGQQDLAALRLDQLGLPLYDIFTARSADGEIAYLLAGDAAAVLGPLATQGVAV